MYARGICVQVLHTSVLIFNEAGGSLEINSNHLIDECVKVNATSPSQNPFGLGGIAK
jgi:hypothetical protein